MTDTRPLGEERINEIEGRAEKATPGEWETCNGTDVFTERGAKNNFGVGARENDGWQICDTSIGKTFIDGGDLIPLEVMEQKLNATFIASARTDVPDLCEALREANELLVKVWKLTLDDDEPETYLRQHGYIKDQKEADDENL